MNGFIESMVGSLPPGARALLLFAVATALSTWLALTMMALLPNPTMLSLAAIAEASKIAVSIHAEQAREQTILLKQICENTAKSPFEAGRCGARP